LYETKYIYAYSAEALTKDLKRVLNEGWEVINIVKEGTIFLAFLKRQKSLNPSRRKP